MNVDAAASGTPEYLIQFLHPEKMLGIIPSTGDLEAKLDHPVVGVPPEQAHEIRRAFRANVSLRARRLLSDSPDLKTALAHSGLRPGTKIAAVGDSITDDLQSWAYLLDEMLRSHLGSADPLVTNFGRSADTTADLLCRFDQVLAMRPDRIIFQVGSNDAKQCSHSEGQTLVSAAETTRNVRALHQAATGSGAQVAWILPPTPNFKRLDDCSWFIEAGLHWDAETFARTRAAISSVVDAAVDPDILFTSELDLLDDGLHPSVHGQSRIALSIANLVASTHAGAR